jgi:hypothetical protein
VTVPESFSSAESALLRVFREQGARDGAPIPAAVLIRNAFGSSNPNVAGEAETALLNLEFRGLIAPGPDPIGATSWMLTPSGDRIVNRRR